MRPKLNLLSDELVTQIIQEGFALLMNPGIQVHNDEGLALLADAGAEVDMGKKGLEIHLGTGKRTSRCTPKAIPTSANIRCGQERA